MSAVQSAKLQAHSTLISKIQKVKATPTTSAVFIISQNTDSQLFKVYSMMQPEQVKRRHFILKNPQKTLSSIKHKAI